MFLKVAARQVFLHVLDSEKLTENTIKSVSGIKTCIFVVGGTSMLASVCFENVGRDVDKLYIDITTILFHCRIVVTSH